MIHSSGLLSLKGISKPELFSFFNKISKDKPKAAISSAIGLLAFFEPSTRTRVSFEAAGLSLGIRWIQLDPAHLSLKKGETYKDTFQTLAQYQPEFMVVRHSMSGFAALAHEWTKIPVLNAGDGMNEHPTQGLLDAFTLWKKNSKKKFKVCFFGDVARSRVVRSDIYAMRALQYDLSVADDQTEDTRLFAKAFKLKIIPRAKISNADVVICLRVQKERGSQALQKSLSRDELGKQTLVMHPGPVIQGEDLAYDLCDFSQPFNLVHEQVANGLLVRRALLKEILETKK